ncbi:MAG: hypothetical protein HDT36_04155 [Clostridiales bacterium]|nr:hypothetical protein [Clostridiales bacterium]
MNIYSKGVYPSDILSNFAANGFILDGVKCESMEGFLQSLKFRDVKRQAFICSLTGRVAKKYGTKKKAWKLTGNAYWRGKKYKRNSAEFDELIKRAYAALYQNEIFKRALESTRGKELKHTIGKHSKRATILTAEEFISNLNLLRTAQA